MNEPTYSQIVETLDIICAPPGETIAGRILALRQEMLDASARAVAEEREKLAAAMAALNAAGLFVAEGTLATGVEGLASRRDAAVERATVAERRLDGAIYALGAEQERADAAVAANNETEAELAQLRAEVARLSAQLDYASEQIQAGLRRGA